MPTTTTVSVLDALEHHASRDPAHPFLVDLTPSGEPRTWSYGRALEDVDRIAAGLRALGVGPRDRVAMRLANSWSFVAVLLATWRAGAIAVPTIRQYAPDELRHALLDCEATCLVLDDDGAEARETLAGVPEGIACVSTRLASPPPGVAMLEQLGGAGDGTGTGTAAARRAVLRSGDDAVVFYTSGTTSRPKGVVLTHGAILESCLISADGLRLRPQDRGLVVLPLFHCNALFMQLIPLLLAGATAVVDDRFSASGYLDALRRHRITLANLTAGAIRSVLAQPARADDREHAVRLLTFALPLHGDEIAQVEDRFGVRAHMAYGLTESCCGGTRTPLHVAPRSGWQSLGVAQTGWRVAVLDERGEPVPGGEIGEIALRGPGVMDRYWRRPQATAEAKRDGWLLTGDLGRLDEAGFLWFHTRIKDMLKPKGENVAAGEIEGVLDAHPAVAESAVVGVFDPHHEERVVAFVSGPGDARDTDGVLAHCARQLAAFKVPAELHWLDELPRTSIGKIDKGALRSRAAAARAAGADEAGAADAAGGPSAR